MRLRISSKSWIWYKHLPGNLKWNFGNMGLSNCLRQPRHRAKNVGRAPTHLFASLPMFQCFVEKTHSRTHTNEQEHCDFVFENMSQESTTNQSRWHTNEPKILVWRRLGAVWGGSWSPAGQKPTRHVFFAFSKN